MRTSRLRAWPRATVGAILPADMGIGWHFSIHMRSLVVLTLLSCLLVSCRRGRDGPSDQEVGLPADPDTGQFYYAMAQPVATAADIQSLAKVRSAMQAIKPLGVNLVVQIFPQEVAPTEWRAYLDVAQEEGLHVIGKIGPTSWNPDPNDLSPITNILAEIHDHPMLYGFFYLHEPWEVFETPQMQAIYREIKATYPNVKLGVGWSGEIGISLQRRNPRRQFSDDLCDICLINLKPFQNDAAIGRRQGEERIELAAAHILQVDPDAELWSSAQVWQPPADKPNPRGFRMPGPAEMEALFCALKEAYPLKGFFWEVWTFDIVTLGALSQPEAIENRQMAGTIYQKCVQDRP